MSRQLIAFLIGTIGFIAYILLVVALGDFVVLRHWAIQTLYYVTAGIVWVFPARWLILWSARGPTSQG